MTLVRFDDVDEPEPGMRYVDRLGPWFDGSGTEIIPVGTEAVELAVELIVDRFEVRTNVAGCEALDVEVTFPHLTDLIQDDWDRVVEGAADGLLPGRGFLIAYEGTGAAVGRLAEDLLDLLVLGRLLPDVWPGCAVLAMEDAVETGLCQMPKAGIRSDDLVVCGDGQLVFVESKCTLGTWSHLRRMGRRALLQLAASRAINPGAGAAILASSLRDKRVGLWCVEEGGGGPAVVAEWSRIHRNWAPERRPTAM